MPPLLDPRVSGSLDGASTNAKEQPGKTRSKKRKHSQKHDSEPSSESGSEPQHPFIIESTEPLANGHRKSASNATAAHRGSGNAELRFFVVDDPRKLKDKDEMRANRQHVMHGVIRKRSHATVIEGSGIQQQHSKRPKCGPVKPPDVQDTSQREMSSSTSRSASFGTMPNILYLPQGALVRTDARQHGHPPTYRDMAPRELLQHTELGNILCTPIERRGSSTLYMATPVDLGIFDNVQKFGSQINPFDTWPMFPERRIDTTRLKYICSQRFGCRSMSEHWVPALVKTKHAFYSTLCISATHDDIMRCSLQDITNNPRSELSHIIATVVKAGVVRMINDALDDTDGTSGGTSDGTLIAILQVIVSEIMTLDVQALRAHQKGFRDIIQGRGGIDQLGVRGQIASIGSIVHYLIAIFWEDTPHHIYTSYANARLTNPPDHSQTYPESPIYCSTRFSSILRSPSPESKTLQILTATRGLTDTLLSLQPRKDSVHPWTDAQSSVQKSKLLELRDYVFSFEPGAVNQKASMEDRIYEAVRLTARLFAHALAHQMPFSKAATDLRCMGENPKPAVHVRIKHALMRTSLDECWGHLAGVLYWITLVAGAAANTASSDADIGSNRTLTIVPYEDTEARKWLAAVAVRCTILLSFEHGAVMLGTLKKMVAIQQILAQKNRASIGSEDLVSVRPRIQSVDVSSGERQQASTQSTHMDIA